MLIFQSLPECCNGYFSLTELIDGTVSVRGEGGESGTEYHIAVRKYRTDATIPIISASHPQAFKLHTPYAGREYSRTAAPRETIWPSIHHVRASSPMVPGVPHGGGSLQDGKLQLRVPAPEARTRGQAYSASAWAGGT